MALYDLTKETAAYEKAQQAYLKAIEDAQAARARWHEAALNLRIANGYTGHPMATPGLTFNDHVKEASLKAYRAASPARHGNLHVANLCYAALSQAGIKCKHNGNDLYLAAADLDAAVEVLTGKLGWNWHAPDQMFWRPFDPRDEVYVHTS